MYRVKLSTYQKLTSYKLRIQQKFPKNLNVAATLSIAGVGFEKISEILTIAKNLPSPDNPKTSYIASLSAIACLKRITSEIEIGT